MLKKKHSIPHLDFSRVTELKLKRRNSDSEINTNRTVKRKNIDEVIQKHKETCKFIQEIHNKLDTIQKNSLADELELNKTMKDIRDRILNLENGADKTPRMVSRCDAMVGNTQLIITNTKSVLEYLKNIDEEATTHDIVTMTILNDIYKEITDLKNDVKRLEDFMTSI